MHRKAVRKYIRVHDFIPDSTKHQGGQRRQHEETEWGCGILERGVRGDLFVVGEEEGSAGETEEKQEKKHSSQKDGQVQRPRGKTLPPSFKGTNAAQASAEWGQERWGQKDSEGQVSLGYSGCRGQWGCFSSLSLIWIHWRVESRQLKYFVSGFVWFFEINFGCYTELYDCRALSIGSKTTTRRLHHHPGDRWVRPDPGGSDGAIGDSPILDACWKFSKETCWWARKYRPNMLLVKHNIWENRVS